MRPHALPECPVATAPRLVTTLEHDGSRFQLRIRLQSDSAPGAPANATVVGAAPAIPQISIWRWVAGAGLVLYVADTFFGKSGATFVQYLTQPCTGDWRKDLGIVVFLALLYAPFAMLRARPRR